MYRLLSSTVVGLIACLMVQETRADDPVFSGPQVGEALTPFSVRTLGTDSAGEQKTLLGKGEGRPVLLIFVHELTRPSIGVTRVLGNYAASRAKDGLEAAVVFLTDDATDTENWTKRAIHALPKGITLGLSPEGIEGPGAYGLNRNVALTILVGKDNKVTANFALVQPSLQADVPRVAKALVDVLGGGEPPSLERLMAMSGMRERADSKPSAEIDLRPILGSFIRKDASPESVREIAARVEKQMDENEALRTRIGEVATNIIRAGKLEQYGTPTAQEFLKKWAEAHGPKEPK